VEKQKTKQLQPSGVEEEQQNRHNTSTNRKTISTQNLKKNGSPIETKTKQHKT
jgi:hypothetical protein